jgi:Pentapeptide repeats (8 copies)
VPLAVVLNDTYIALLKNSGVAAWNAWREQIPIPLDLSGADIRGADLSGANLIGVPRRGGPQRGGLPRGEPQRGAAGSGRRKPCKSDGANSRRN